MTSNQDNKQKILDIPMTGIEVMNQLSLDANKMFYIAQEGLLLPYSPKDPLWQKLQMNSRCDSPESILSRWMYRESDVEDFKKYSKESCLVRPIPGHRPGLYGLTKTLQLSQT